MHIIKITNKYPNNTVYINSDWIEYFYYNNNDNKTTIVCGQPQTEDNVFYVEGNVTAALTRAMTENEKPISVE